tara:strand:+ start:605 stop:757 length:153 start_codon:yes stop_codon:yes gene_type:complete
MVRQPKRKYGKYDFRVVRDGKNVKLVEFVGMNRRGFLFRNFSLKNVRRIK